MTHISVSKLTTIGSDNGLSSGRRQAIILTNAGILVIGPFGINFSDNLIEINAFSFIEMHLTMASAEWRLFRRGLNELNENFLWLPWNRPIRQDNCPWSSQIYSTINQTTRHAFQLDDAILSCLRWEHLGISTAHKTVNHCLPYVDFRMVQWLV